MMPNIPHTPSFAPTASLETLRRRAELLGTVRRFFIDRGYWEVDTPILSRDVVVDAHLEPVEAKLPDGDEWFLQTSPEFFMKRLLATGAEAVFQIAHAFRQGESGRYHNPEFAMLEWYRTGDTHFDQMRFVEDLVTHVFRTAAELSPHKNGTIIPPRHFDRLTYDEAFQLFAGTTVLDLSAEQLARLAVEKSVEPPPGLAAGDRDGWLNFLLAELVEPQLGRDRPVFLYDYPASQAALARIGDGVAERFELYVRGIEICNGYHELTDPDELSKRAGEQNAIREAAGRRRLPEESRLIEAMQAGLPASTGVALGFDRLVMLALDADRLADVMAFPFDRA